MASKVQSYEDLEVWQMAMSLAEDCYRLTADFPREEIYGLTAQIRRAVISIPANIAEGYGRNQTGNFPSLSSDCAGFGAGVGNPCLARFKAQDHKCGESFTMQGNHDPCQQDAPLPDPPN